jgi:hypothetical protein
LRNSGASRSAFRILVAIAFLAARPASSPGSGKTPYLIDDFDGPTALKNWRFSSSVESPAGMGELALGPGHHQQGAVLTYRLPCDRGNGCGAYAAALWKPASPLPKTHDPAISLWIRFPAEVEVDLVAKDTGGQTLRFPIRTTIEHFNASGWQYAVVRLAGDASNPGINGRLVEAGILVQARGPTAVEGSVSFDDVELRDSSEIFLIGPGTQTEPPPPDSLELAPRLGVNIHLLRDDHALELAHTAGFAFVRMDMVWANVERNGRYRFGAYDALMRSLEARQMGVLWILDYGHPDHGGGPPRAPQDIAAFGRFVEAAAAHFKGRNVRYEIWNEPNIRQFWAPSPNASEYGVLLREAAAAIHGVDPSAVVSSGGVSGVGEAFLRGALDPNVAAGLTAIAVHPYRKTGPETVAPDLASLRNWAVQAFGPRIEVWDTEGGYSSAEAVNDAPSNGHNEATRMRQAALAVREILTACAVGLPVAVWYDLRDDGPDAENPEHNYGLLDASGNEKPAMKAVRGLMDAISRRKYAGMISETPAGVHAIRLDGSTDTVLIVWSDQTGSHRKVEYSKRDLISVTGLMGQAIKTKDRPSGHAQVEVDEISGPIYLRWGVGSR